MSRIVSWFSCGAASAVATKLAQPDVIAYCETGAEHPDNKRFMTDCEKWFGQEITILQNQKFSSTWDVWEKRKYISGIKGAPADYPTTEPIAHHDFHFCLVALVSHSRNLQQRG